MNLMTLVALILVQFYLWIFATPAFAAVKRPSMGPANTQHTIVMYADYQCPYSQRGWETMKSLLEEFEGRLEIQFRQMPLSFHPQAEQAAKAALCANEQGKFEEMHNRLYEINRDLNKDSFAKLANELDLNKSQFDECMSSKEAEKIIAEDVAQAAKLKISGTPSFVVNGEVVGGAYPLSHFQEMLKK